MEIRSIKGVDDETWKKFRELAERSNLKMSLLLKMMINRFDNEGRDFWKRVLNRERNLSDMEADKIMRLVSESRKERGFRE